MSWIRRAMRGAFAAVLDVLERGGVVLLFPEGKSHSDPALAPLKTGLARIALMARNERRSARRSRSFRLA